MFVLARSSLVINIKHTGWSFGLFSSKHFCQRIHIFTRRKNRPCSVCFSSKFDGHLSTPAEKIIFVLLENTDNSGSKKTRLSSVL